MWYHILCYAHIALVNEYFANKSKIITLLDILLIFTLVSESKTVSCVQFISHWNCVGPMGVTLCIRTGSYNEVGIYTQEI